MSHEYVQVRLAAKRRVAANVIEFHFEAIDGSSLSSPAPGDHIEILTPSGLPRRYSTTAGPHGSGGGWTVGIALDPAGSGGSASMHMQATTGDIMNVRPPTTNFPLKMSNSACSSRAVSGLRPFDPCTTQLGEKESRMSSYTLQGPGRRRRMRPSSLKTPSPRSISGMSMMDGSICGRS